MKLREKIEITLLTEPVQTRYGVLRHQTPVGFSLNRLASLWGISIEEIIAKLASDAVMEEEENIIDGEYIAPDWVERRVLR